MWRYVTRRYVKTAQSVLINFFTIPAQLSLQAERMKKVYMHAEV